MTERMYDRFFEKQKRKEERYEFHCMGRNGPSVGDRTAHWLCADGDLHRAAGYQRRYYPLRYRTENGDQPVILHDAGDSVLYVGR